MNAPRIRDPKDPLSRSQRLVLSYLESVAYAATQGTRNSLERRGFIDIARNHPLRGLDNRIVKVDSAQITAAGLEAVNWPTGDGSYRTHMLTFSEADAHREHEVRHPMPRNYREGFNYLFHGDVLGGVIANVGDTVEVDFCIDLHERNFGVSFTLEQAQHLSGTVAAAWAAARTHGGAS
jgi:hypothetical protein